MKALGTLPFMTWVRRIEIDYIRPVHGDQEITITSFVREFCGPDAFVDCKMTDAAGTVVSTCVMTVAHVDKASRRATDWPPDLIAVFRA
ncbi:MAG: acyl-CoA thioesterase [Rhodanobacteraceae bacterium]